MSISALDVTRALDQAAQATESRPAASNFVTITNAVAYWTRPDFREEPDRMSGGPWTVDRLRASREIARDFSSLWTRVGRLRARAADDLRARAELTVAKAKLRDARRAFIRDTDEALAVGLGLRRWTYLEPPTPPSMHALAHSIASAQAAMQDDPTVGATWREWNVDDAARLVFAAACADLLVFELMKVMRWPVEMPARFPGIYGPQPGGWTVCSDCTLVFRTQRRDAMRCRQCADGRTAAGLREGLVVAKAGGSARVRRPVLDASGQLSRWGSMRIALCASCGEFIISERSRSEGADAYCRPACRQAAHRRRRQGNDGRGVDGS